MRTALLSLVPAFTAAVPISLPRLPHHFAVRCCATLSCHCGDALPFPSHRTVWCCPCLVALHHRHPTVCCCARPRVSRRPADLFSAVAAAVSGRTLPCLEACVDSARKAYLFQAVRVSGKVRAPSRSCRLCNDSSNCRVPAFVQVPSSWNDFGFRLMTTALLALQEYCK